LHLLRVVARPPRLLNMRWEDARGKTRSGLAFAYFVYNIDRISSIWGDDFGNAYINSNRAHGLEKDIMALRDSISSATKDAMKAKDPLRVSTLRLISAAIKDRDIAARSEDRCGGIDDGEILSLLAKMVKQREESAKTYDDNGRPELAERERSEIGIVRDFMPKPLTDDDMKAAITKIVEDSGATCLKDMGKIMGKLKTDYAGRIDMGKAGAIVKDHLCS